MKKFSRPLALGCLAAASLLAAGAAAQDSDLITADGVITGQMQIDFRTRTMPDTSGDYAEGSAGLGVQDIYAFALSVAKTTEFSGQVVRQPNIYTKTMRKLKQGAALGFDINLSVLNPRDLKQKKAVGKWVGVVPINTESGAYDLAGGNKEERPLRIVVDTVGSAKGFEDMFRGRMYGKAEKKDTLAEYTFRRIVGKKTVEVKVKRSDPMKFVNVELAKGPAEIYPHTAVNGRLDYDYETGNWFTDGLRFKYTLNGKEVEDIVTGSIKWVEDPDRATNGKGFYEFNLRFNEEQNRAAGSEEDAFAGMSEEDAFFAVDNSIPCLTGTVSYVDTMMADGETPSSSVVTYNLNANKLNKQQIMNFFKLWLLAVGPTNDE